MLNKNKLYSWAWGMDGLPKVPYYDAAPLLNEYSHLPSPPPPKPPEPPPGSLSLALELPGAISLPDEVLDDDWDW